MKIERKGKRGIEWGKEEDKKEEEEDFIKYQKNLSLVQKHSVHLQNHREK